MTTSALSVCLSRFHDSDHGRTTIPETHLLSGMGSSLNASQHIGVGVTDFALVVNQSQ